MIRFSLLGLFAVTALAAAYLLLFRMAGIGVVVVAILFATTGAVMQQRSDRRRLAAWSANDALDASTQADHGKPLSRSRK